MKFMNNVDGWNWQKIISSYCPFLWPHMKCGKVYNNQHGLKISLEHLRLLCPSKRKVSLKELKQQNGGSQEKHRNGFTFSLF